MRSMPQRWSLAFSILLPSLAAANSNPCEQQIKDLAKTVVFVNPGYCAGVAISPNYVLTARHCVEGLDVTVIAPREDIGAEIKGSPSKVCLHKEQDLALLRFDGQARSIDNLEQHSLRQEEFARRLRSGLPTEVYLLGRGLIDDRNDAWGAVYWAGPLMAYRNNLPDCSQTGDQFCAGALQFDVCKGDSGSPAFWFRDCTPTLVGIVAEVQSTNNNGCGNQFDIYETIDLEWVAEILKDDKHCL